MKKFKALTRYNRWVARTALLIAKLQYRTGAREEALQTASHTAGYCALNFTGMYFWPELERFLHRVAADHLQPVPSATGGEGVLHVMTTAYATGGHTRYLARWLEADTTCTHLLLLHQTEALPPVLQELAFRRPDLRIIQLDPRAPVVQRAGELRSLAARFRAVVLHQHANDVVPVLAFAGKGGPSVGYLNHGDHTFWLGASVTDLLIQFRTSLASMDAARRGLAQFAVLPVPLATAPPGNAAPVREQSTIPAEATVLLTISAPYKFVPNDRHHFFRSARQFLNRHPEVHWLVAGPGAGHPAAASFQHPRLHLLGQQEETAALETACDIYVDSFPFSSPTSAIQAAARGKAVVLMYRPEESNIVFDGSSPLCYPPTLEAWEAELERLTSDAIYRKKLGEKQQAFIRQHHEVEGGWKHQAQSVLQQLTGMEHRTFLPKRPRYTVTGQEAFIYGQIANNIRLSGIVISRNPLLWLATHALSAVFVICRLIMTGRWPRNYT